MTDKPFSEFAEYDPCKPEGCFRVYRLAEAPQEYVDFARLGRDDDPIVVVEKGASEPLRAMADASARYFLWPPGFMWFEGEPLPHQRYETPTHIIYTVDRG